MEVILNQDLVGVGKAGAVIKVKDGFARNFLLPNKLAVPVTCANLKKIEQENLRKTQNLQKLKKEAEDLKAKLASISVTIPVLVQDDEKLYGSITAQEIEAALKEEEINIGKNLIVIEQPIKSLGIYEIPIKLHPEVLAKVKIWIVKK